MVKLEHEEAKKMIAERKRSVQGLKQQARRGDRKAKLFLKVYKPDPDFCLPSEISRDDPILIHVVKELGPRAAGQFASLAIVKIPHNVRWHIEEYGGAEWAVESYQT
jgi:hypothetical protein